MGFALRVAFRYMSSKRRAFISMGTLFATFGVALGTAALATVLGVTGGFRAQFREKVLGVNAHVLVLKYASEFTEYREVMARIEPLPEVTGIAPFVINPMMLTHQDHTATGVLVKGVDPARVGDVLDVPRHIVEGSMQGLRLPGAKPPPPPKPWIEEMDEPAGVVAPAPTPPPDEGDLGFLNRLREEVEKGKQAAAHKQATPDPSAAALVEPALALDQDAPVGSVEPAQGYESVLPDDDALPAELQADPCSDKNASLPGIVIGITLKHTLAANLGDCIEVTSPTIGYALGNGVMRPPIAKRFRVVGIFEAGFEQYDAKLAYTDLYEAQAFYDGGDTVTGVEMKVQDIDRAKEVAAKIDATLGDNALYHTLDWEELNHGLFTALRIQQVLMSLVLALIILVAAFTVIATLIMVVLDKRKEIAVMKAMGATSTAVLRVFLYQGLFIGIAGALVGLALGYAVCEWALKYGFPLDPKVYFISKLPVQMRPDNFLFTGLFAILVCLIATVWPAQHAARLRPADAFREQ
jgi:lipoprotein-releasing system permease protein